MSDKLPWPHAPLHQLGETGAYFVTAATYHHQHFFRGSEALARLQELLLNLAKEYEWQLEAWCIFSNHYHIVAHAPATENSAESLKSWLSRVHQNSAIWINRRDDTPQRRVWFNYRETQLTYVKSYLARLNYTHQNAVKHGLVKVAHLYPWCSAGWFERTALPSQVQTMYRFKVDQVHVQDEFEVDNNW